MGSARRGKGQALKPGMSLCACLIYLRLPACSTLFATHHHGLCGEPELAPLVQLGHMRAAVQPGRGVLPSFRLEPGELAGPAGGAEMGSSAVQCQQMGRLKAGKRSVPICLQPSPVLQARRRWGRVAWRWLRPAACRQR